MLKKIQGLKERQETFAFRMSLKNGLDVAGDKARKILTKSCLVVGTRSCHVVVALGSSQVQIKPTDHLGTERRRIQHELSAVVPPATIHAFIPFFH